MSDASQACKQRSMGRALYVWKAAAKVLLNATCGCGWPLMARMVVLTLMLGPMPDCAKLSASMSVAAPVQRGESASVGGVLRCYVRAAAHAAPVGVRYAAVNAVAWYSS